MGRALRRAFDEVLDGPRTGRYDITKLEKVEKTYIGTKVEILLRTALGLDRGRVMDVLICGHEVDVKFSISGAWMIPREAVNHICMVVVASDPTSSFRIGIVRITPERLNRGANQDGKKSMNATGRAAIAWIIPAGVLPENLLLRLAAEDREAILAPETGTERLAELFRRAQGRIITREVVTAIGHHDDPEQWASDARARLLPEAIAVLSGDDPAQREEAARRGLPVPGPGQFVSGGA